MDSQNDDYGLPTAEFLMGESNPSALNKGSRSTLQLSTQLSDVTESPKSSYNCTRILICSTPELDKFSRYPSTLLFNLRLIKFNSSRKTGLAWSGSILAES